MSFVGDLIGNITGGAQATQGARDAAATQAGAATEGISAIEGQIASLTEMMAPYISAGGGALSAQQDLLGLGGTVAQEQAISGIAASPYFQSLEQQSENAILQNASATGGLRGGNTQDVLSQNRPQLLNQLIQQRLGNLGGLSQMGQQTALGQGGLTMQAGGNIANLMGQRGAATAGGQLAAGQQQQNLFGTMAGLAGAGLAGGYF